MDLGLCVVFVNRSLCEVLFLLVIVLYVLLLFIAYDYPFGISKLIYSYIYMNSRYKPTSNPLSEVIFCKWFFFGGKHLLACGKLTWSYHLSMVDNLTLDLFIEVSVSSSSQKNERSCICVIRLSYSPCF